MPIKITPLPMKKENTAKWDELFLWAKNKFEQSVTARSQQIDGDYRRWVDNYVAKPKQTIRVLPYYKASNFVPQLIRMHTDILSARLVGLLFGTRPFWRPKTFVSAVTIEMINAVGEWMDKKCQNDINFFDPVDIGIFLTVKTGLHVLKNTWIMDPHSRVDSSGNVVTSVREGLVIDNVPFDDMFMYPITAQFFRDCTALFHRLRLTKESVDFRSNLPSPSGWDKKAADFLKGGQSSQSAEGAARQSLAQTAGINLTVDVIRPYTAVEMWASYELEPGKLSDIVLTFNPKAPNAETGILRHCYNYFPGDLDPFVDLRIMPREGLVVGDCVPNILEQSQEEQAQIHNSRRDANTIGLVPGWKKKTTYTGANPATEWYPGKVFEVDNMDDLEPLEFSVNYNSLIEEESALMALAERYTGITPAQQGFGSGPMGKKGIYASQATLALLTEGNKRQDIYLQRLRRSFHKQGQLIYCSYRDFRQDGAEWKQYGENGNLLKQAFALREPADFRGMFFDLGASDASANKEVDRQNLLLMSQTMSAYYQQVMGLSQIIAQMPPNAPARELALQILDGARDLANRILFVFDVFDRKRLMPDVRALLGAGKPGDQSGAAQQAGVPDAEANVSRSDLETLSNTLAQITPAVGSGAGGPQNGDGRAPS